MSPTLPLRRERTDEELLAEAEHWYRRLSPGEFDRLTPEWYQRLGERLSLPESQAREGAAE